MQNEKSKKIAFIIPDVGIYGGIAVVLNHANRLKKRGYDVAVLTMGEGVGLSWFPGNEIVVSKISEYDKLFEKGADILIATHYLTAYELEKLNAGRKIYFVQSDERRFNALSHEILEKCDNSYKLPFEFMTEAKWIQRWLGEEFGIDAHYVPNGIDTDIFHEVENPYKKRNGKTVLLEGTIDAKYKGVADAYKAVKDLDCDIWFVSNSGKPKESWKYKKFFSKVPMAEMSKIYSSCDVLLKMSRVEGFYGPPMEAMACGCAVVTGKVTGYDEYIVDGYNALVVQQGDIEGAKKAVKRILEDENLRKTLIENGYKTVKEWNWEKSVDLLENVLNGKTPEKAYTEDFPERYDFIEENKRLWKGTIKNLKNKLLEQQEKEKTELNNLLKQKEHELLDMKSTFRWKLADGLFVFYKAYIKRFIPRFLFKLFSPLFLYLNYIRECQVEDRKRFLFDVSKIENLKIGAIKPIEFEVCQKPEASIVIPVFNKWNYTYTCLESLRKNIKDVSYEIIILDNASSDETSEMMKKIEGVTYVKTKENLGFVGGCNEGARHAKGDYVVFLNNDTHVLEGWLESLLETFEKNEKIGLAGSKLIYPNGKLQEAGGIVWKNRNVWNYGRNADPLSYEFNYLKDVDYCSGASIMVPRKLFEELKGFDQLFAPAYFEDTDLSFRIRKMGYRTVYQPKSELVHFEGVTAGKDVNSGLKRYQELNWNKFFDRWQDTLNSNGLDSEIDGAFLARDRSQGKKVMLFMDNNVPTYNKDAGSFIAFEYLKLFLKQGYKIVFWPHNLAKLAPYTETLQQLGIEVVYGRVSFSEFIKENGKHIDLAVVSRPHLGEAYIDRIKKNTDAKIIYMPHDLHYLRETRAAELSGSDEQKERAAETKNTELAIMKKSDVSLFFSDKEVDIMKKESTEINADVIPWIQDLNDGIEKGLFERNGILFVGGFGHQPNADAVEWFHDEVLPIIKKEIPGMRATIIGSNPTEKIRSFQGEDFDVKGFVEDVDPYFNGARVFVAPLRFGAGFKGKIALSMSYGLPVVTTEIGAEGMGLVDGENAMITDDAAEFAAKVVRLYNNSEIWEKMSENSIKHMRNNFSVSAAEKKINEIMKNLAI